MTTDDNQSEQRDTWYSARLLYESVVDDGDPTAEVLWEEKIYVVRVGPDEDVVAKVKQLAIDEQEAFDNVHGDKVRWTFRELLEIQDITAYSVGDGTEVSSSCARRIEVHGGTSPQAMLTEPSR